MQLERHTWNACDDLVEKLWGGDIGEVEFFELGLELGMSLDDLGSILADVQAEDGTL